MIRTKACVFLIALFPALPLSAAAQQPYDLLIRNGRVVDGTGNPWYYADVAISGDRIAAVGDLQNVRARRVIDASGLYVAPGFIDVHTHAGPGLATAELGSAEPLLAQGLTTVIVNPDGGGPLDLGAETAATGARRRGQRGAAHRSRLGPPRGARNGGPGGDAAGA